MAMQDGRSLYAALKAETTLGVVPAVVTGAKKFPINPGSGLTLAMAEILSGAITGDGEERRPRSGSHSVSGTLDGDLTYEHVDVLEAGMRTTWASDILDPVVPLVKRSYTIEVYEPDIDVSTLSKGCRVAGYRQSGAPDQPIRMSYPVVGITQEVRETTSAPFYTTPTEPSDDYMTTTDAAIEIDGSPVLVLTGWDASVGNGAATRPVVGSKFSPDVFTNLLGLNGSITALRESADLQKKYIANDPVDLVITASDLAGNLLIFRYLNLLLRGFTQGIGEDNGETVTIPWRGGKFGGVSAIQIERTPAV